MTGVRPAGAQLLLPDGVLPAWSVEGTSLVCSRLGTTGEDADVQVWIVHLDGAPPDTLIDDPQGAWFPQWLPDGERLAYYRRGAFVIIDPAGGEPVVWPVPQVFDDPGMGMTPDGKLLYTRNYSYTDFETWALDPDTGASSFVHEEGGVVISPDGQFIAYKNAQDTLVVAPSGQGESYRLGRGLFPSWTSDSRHVVYTGFGSDGEVNLYISNWNGTAQQQLTDDPEFEWYPRVSPVANRVAYSRSISDSPPLDLWILDFELPPLSVEARTWSQIKQVYRGR